MSVFENRAGGGDCSGFGLNLVQQTLPEASDFLAEYGGFATVVVPLPLFLQHPSRRC